MYSREPAARFRGHRARTPSGHTGRTVPGGVRGGPARHRRRDRTGHRADYYRAMLRMLGVDEPSAALLDELDAPPAGPAVEPFPEVRAILDQLHAGGLPMCVGSESAVSTAATPVRMPGSVVHKEPPWRATSGVTPAPVFPGRIGHLASRPVDMGARYPAGPRRCPVAPVRDVRRPGSQVGAARDTTMIHNGRVGRPPLLGTNGPGFPSGETESIVKQVDLAWRVFSGTAYGSPARIANSSEGKAKCLFG